MFTQCDRCKSDMVKEEMLLEGGSVISVYRCNDCGRTEYGTDPIVIKDGYPSNGNIYA